MTRKELKQQAKETMKGRWGKAIGLVLVYQILTGAIYFLCNFIMFLGPIVFLIISVPISFGFVGALLKYARNEEVGYLDFFTLGFDNFGKAWGITGRVILKLIGYYIGFVVSTIALVAVIVASENADSILMLGIGLVIFTVVLVCLYFLLITKAYYYSLIEYLGNDMKELTSKEVVDKSKELMKGHRWEFFVLQLSFIGWGMLAVLSCGIGFYFLLPYMYVTYIKFYESLLNNNVNTNNEKVIKEQ